MSDAREWVSVDGVIRARSEIDVEAARRFGVFDTLLADRGLRWFEERHLAHLRAACEHFAIPVFEAGNVARELARFAAALDERPTLLRTLALRGDGRRPSVVIEARAPRVVPGDGVELLPVVSEPDPLGAWKTTPRAERDRCIAEAERAGCFDALRVLPSGEVVDVARGNLFAVVDGVVCTPPRAAGVLPGIVRGLLLESLAGAIEAPLTRADLQRATEIWITSSGLGIAPVRAVRGIALQLAGPAGPHGQRARAVFQQCEAVFAAHSRARATPS